MIDSPPGSATAPLPTKRRRVAAALPRIRLLTMPARVPLPLPIPLLLLLACVAPVASTLGQASTPDAPAAAAPEVGTEIGGGTVVEVGPGRGTPCLACGRTIREDQQRCVIRRERRRIELHVDHCLESWRDSADRLFGRVQAKGALFDAAATSVLGPRWDVFAFSIYVLVGVVFGALTAYVAVDRGHHPVRWFFAGVLFNVLAFGAILLAGRGRHDAGPEGVPPGLRKVPRTRTPRRCDECGTLVHPAADRCPKCGTALEPRADAERPVPATS